MLVSVGGGGGGEFPVIVSTVIFRVENRTEQNEKGRIAHHYIKQRSSFICSHLFSYSSVYFKVSDTVASNYIPLLQNST